MLDIRKRIEDWKEWAREVECEPPNEIAYTLAEAALRAAVAKDLEVRRVAPCVDGGITITFQYSPLAAIEIYNTNEVIGIISWEPGEESVCVSMTPGEAVASIKTLLEDRRRNEA